MKEKLDHGQWLPWLKGEFGWSVDTAQRFMRVSGLVKNRTLRDLNMDVSALYLILGPQHARTSPARSDRTRQTR